MRGIDHTHNPSADSWVPGSNDHPDFPVQNLPLGIFVRAGELPRVGTAIGDHVLDLAGMAEAGLLPEFLRAPLTAQTLNPLFALPPASRIALRQATFARLTSLASRSKVSPHLYSVAECTMLMPFDVGDYTDFYVGIHHATNIGKQFRPDNPLLPNYKHVPIGYHGRASSIRVSGEPVLRPKGQRKPPAADVPDYGPTQMLDFELELGVWISGENALGEAVSISQAIDRVGGFSLLNDWSARDFQAWEYQPLGPFLSKNFLTTVSPWVITVEALAPFRVAQPERSTDDPAPLPYLFDADDQAHGALAVTLESYISTAAMRKEGQPPFRLGTGPATSMYWTVAQMVTHHAANGCNLRSGDLLGTGTISTPDNRGLGSLMEMSRGGTAPLELPTGEYRNFLEDGDELTLRAKAECQGFRTIGFGQCSGVVAQTR